MRMSPGLSCSGQRKTLNLASPLPPPGSSTGRHLARQRFEVLQAGSTLIYGIYIRYDHTPTDVDLAALAGLGIPVQYRLRAVPALRARASYSQIPSVRELPGVVRIEARVSAPGFSALGASV